MEVAVCEAEKALKRGEVPVGAVIVKDGKMISRAHNLTSLNPLFHAEILAMLKLKPEDLKGSTLYITMEPCVMCSGALVIAKVKEVVFSVYNDKFGGTYTLYQIPLDLRLNHQVRVRKAKFDGKVKRLLEKYFEGKRITL